MIVEYYHHPPVLGMTWWLHKEVIRTTSDYKIHLGLLLGSFPAIPTGRLLILDFPRTFENGCNCYDHVQLRILSSYSGRIAALQLNSGCSPLTLVALALIPFR